MMKKQENQIRTTNKSQLYQLIENYFVYISFIIFYQTPNKL